MIGDETVFIVHSSKVSQKDCYIGRILYIMVEIISYYWLLKNDINVIVNIYIYIYINI